MTEHNNKPEKLTDKAFSRLVVTSIIGILFCIVCLCSTTYAWFADNAPSQSNEIKIAEDCLLEVVVTKDGEAIADIEDGVELQAGESYVVTLTLPADTASGYCVMLAANRVNYYSDYILRHNGPDDQTLSFELMVEETQTVVFTPHWGIYARESDVVDGKLVIP